MVLKEQVDFCFKGVVEEFISVNKNGASWTECDPNDSVTLKKPSLKNTLKYLRGNCYFKLGNKIFRQLMGISMASDSQSWKKNTCRLASKYM